MKKKLIVALAGLCTTAMLASCGGSKGGDKPAASETATQTTSEESKAEEVTSAETEASKKESKSDSSSKIVLGEPIEVSDEIEVTVKSFSVVKDYQDKPVLKIVYDFKNNGDDEAAPFLAVIFKGFQDGVECGNDVTISDDIDLSIGQKTIKAGSQLENVEAEIGIEDMDKPLSVELSELISFSDTVFTYDIENLNELG